MSEFKRTHTVSAHAGFTLVELLMVVALMGALAVMSIPIFTSYITTARNKRCIGDIRTIDKAVTSYILEKNALPASLADVGMANQKDPWGRPYQYQDVSPSSGNTPLEYDVTGERLNEDYDLYSQGKDGASNAVFDSSGADDIVRANNGSYAGERS